MAGKNKQKSKDTEVRSLLSDLELTVGRLERFETFLQSINANSDELAIQQLESRLELIKPIVGKYAELCTQARSLGVTSEDIMSFPDFEEQYLLLVSKASLILKNQNIIKQELRSSNNNSNAVTNSSATTGSKNIKLPILNLPIFSGSYSEWNSFHETFMALIDKNSQLSDVERFFYLKDSLKGPAKEVLHELQATGSNYHIALRILEERYSNQKLIILSHLESILDHPKMQKESATELRKLHDNIVRHLRALENLNVSDEQFKASVITYVIKNKVDSRTSAEFSKLKVKQIPDIDEVKKFLSERCELLEDTNANNPKTSYNNSMNPKNPSKFTNIKPFNSSHKQAFVSANAHVCPLCNQNHQLFACSKFLELSVDERFKKTSDLEICKNCLKHSSKYKCLSNSSCRFCHKAHNSLLCFANKSKTEKNVSCKSVSEESILDSEVVIPEDSKPDTAALSSCTQICSDQVLLSTAIVHVKSSDGKWLQARCLLDSGSQSCFISEQLVSKLDLKPKTINTSVVGINLNVSKLSGSVKVQISSLHNSYQTELSCLVLPKITECLPLKGFSKSQLNIPSNVKLADISFNRSRPVDLLIGASHFYSLLCVGQISLGKNQPILKKTLLGWIISGNLPMQKSVSTSVSNTVCSNFVVNGQVSNEELNRSLSAFWQLDQVQPISKRSLLSREEKFCEEYFERTVTRNSEGRLIVSIPFNSKLLQLGDSENIAIERFYKLERKLNKDPTLKTAYTDFLKDYERRGHMTKESFTPDERSGKQPTKISTLESEIDISKIPSFFLPHHAVLKSNSLSTKLRVVFDGSCSSNTGVSINDTQLVGPVIQDDLFTILLRFRQHAVAFTGDCEKMYRMILIEPSERKLQKIFWRDNPQDPICSYQLNTITYGTASASYLATKCLSYLADINQERFPKASQIIKSNFYMDDLLFSVPTSEEVSQIKDQITAILAEAGIPLRKFLCNDPQVIEDSDNPTTTLHTIPLGERANAKVLGLSWNSLSDSIFYKVELKQNGPSISKRTILSVISQLFDPLGLLSPVIIVGKILIQKLWELELSWDESIPESINRQWLRFKDELSLLESLQIPRCITPSESVQIQLHGFSDGSAVAYGACIYVRCLSSQGQITSKLLCAKSRVAPLHTVSIPRLELCAAVLLAQLMHRVQEALGIKNQKNIFLWTDSTVVLNWLRSAPNKYKVFVANRIALLQELFPFACWHHVGTKENPADLVSRGTSVSNIISNPLWWNGPNFLLGPKNFCESPEPCSPDSDPELKKVCCTIVATDTEQEFDFFKSYSNFRKLQRVTAWLFRFHRNCKHKNERTSSSFLTVAELQGATEVLVKRCQQERFPDEIKALSSDENIRSKSSILPLNPFLDEKGLLRVGGRITNAKFPFDKKHPLLLPKVHTLTNLIFEQYHQQLMHCGAQQLLSCVREQFWPLAGRDTARKTIHNCVKCFKAKPTSQNPLMGNLPAKRLQVNTPVFYNTGLDYAGPVFIKDRMTRNAKMIKSYICVFICLVTRAIHLELVSDLTTKSFMSTLKRFIARRGKPRTLSSDNAKTFVGANNELRDLYKFLQGQGTQESLSKYLTDEGITWEFIIPRAPHQGGMWESAVKSTKFHLKRVLGNTNLNFEDFNTVLIQIESILNSRPLSALSTDPEDFSPLTPGHFLIGRALSALPEKDMLPIAENRLSLYQRCQRLTQHFWNRWSVEVVPELQRRSKWFAHLPDLIETGTLVLIKEDDTPPLTWALGRVLNVHRGSDDVIRSATLRLPGGHTTKRPVHKLCALPVPV